MEATLVVFRHLGKDCAGFGVRDCELEAECVLRGRSQDGQKEELHNGASGEQIDGLQLRGGPRLHHFVSHWRNGRRAHGAGTH